MSQIDELLKELCPEGVPFVPLYDVAQTLSGLKSKTKADFSDGNARFISYKNAFANPVVNQQAQDFVKVSLNEKQNELHVGDIVFTGSSENIEDVGMSSVVATEPLESLYLNSFCFIVRFNDPFLILPQFSKYLFRSSLVRKQIRLTASGVTRINVSKGRFMKVRIPVPPLEVQREIVGILDQFTQLEAELGAELDAELDARRKQYSFYRDSLLTFPEGQRRIPLGEFAVLVRGNGMPKADFVAEGVPAIHYGQIYTHYGTYAFQTKSFVSGTTAAKLAKVDPGDVVITNTSENIDDVGKAVAWLGADQAVTGGHATVIKHNENPKFLAYYFQSSEFNRIKRKYASGTKVIDVSAKSLAKIDVPLPTREEQDRIVETLDKFDALVNDLSSRLPAELAARRKQYEYYRDRLLTFKEAAA